MKRTTGNRTQQQFETGLPDVRATITLDPSDGWWEAVLETDDACLFLASYETRHEARAALLEAIAEASKGGQA